MSNEFKGYHPVVNMVYFVLVIGFAMFVMHPLCLGITLACGFSYSVMLKGESAARAGALRLLPAMLVAALLNPAFNHEGVTVILYLPGGNPLTLESILFGISAALLLAGVLCWFSCYNEIMTSDKFIYLFGRVIPSLSLILSMTLRFVPRFAAQLKAVANAQRCMGRGVSDGGIVKRAGCGLAILAVTVGWAFENSIETADSMRSRGYGAPGRTAFSVYSFDRRDAAALTVILLLGAYIFFGIFSGFLGFRYFPSVYAPPASPASVGAFAAYFALCALPMFLELAGVRKWKTLR